MGKGGEGQLQHEPSQFSQAGTTMNAATGHRASSQPSSVLEQPQFRPFSGDENFDVADWLARSRVLAGSHTTAQAQSEQLREGLSLVDAELAQEVTGKQGELLGNVRRMLDAERALGDVLLSVESLQAAIWRIRAEIQGPYEHSKARTRQLRNLHATVELLRHLIHRLKLAQKLRTLMEAPTATLDLAKAAKLISDIRAVDAEADLSGIDAAAVDQPLIQSALSTVHAQAEVMLAEGLESMSQAKVGSALQVYFNLDELPQVVQSLMATNLQRLEKQARAALDARHLGSGAAGSGAPPVAHGRPTHPGVTGTGSWQDKLWAGLRELAESISTATATLWHLQRVITKKKDPLTHVCFLDVVVPPDQPLLTEQFWSALVKMLGDVFAALTKPVSKNSQIRDVLTNGYPKLAALLETMFDRLATETTIKGVAPAVTPEHLTQLLHATGPVQGVYLGGSLSRMSDAVMAAFPGGSRGLTGPADVQRCISVIHEELKAGAFSPQMAVMVAHTAGKALELLAEKAEFMAITGPEARAVVPGTPASPAQLRNIALCSQVQEVHRSLAGMLARLPAAAAEELSVALDVLQATALEVVAPLFKSVMEGVEERLLKIHALDFTGDTSAGVTATSAYISDAAGLLTHFRAEYLARFSPPPNLASCVGSLVERMAARTLIFHVRHASLVRPLSQSGRLQLAKDLAELQLAVGASLLPLEQLGQPYRVVKAFRSLLFAEPASLVGPSTLLQELPPSVVAHHLFTRLDPSVQAPHERSSLTPAQYSLWLDTHTTEEVLRGVHGALTAANAVAIAAGDPTQQDALRVTLHLCTQAGE